MCDAFFLIFLRTPPPPPRLRLSFFCGVVPYVRGVTSRSRHGRAALQQVETTSFSAPEGPPSAYLGCPHPQAFLDSAIGATVAPVWHLGPCTLLTEVMDLAPLMFAVGPEYTGCWTAERPLDAVSSAIASRVLRRLQVCCCHRGVALAIVTAV